MSPYDPIEGLLKEMRRPPRTGRKDYHKDKARSHGKAGRHYTKWQRRRIIAWDGEGRTLKDGSHIYNMISNSEGAVLLNEDGIHTQEALDFLLEHNDHLAINVIFGGSYDVNMILGDLSPRDVDILWSTGMVRWRHYQIRYANRKKFTVERIKVSGGRRVKDGKSFVLWDVLGFFQTNFVSSVRKWLGNDPMLDMIERMKASRSEFTGEDIEEILAYNKEENRLLVKLMEKLFESLDTCGIILRRYDGAGAIAGALMERARVSDHKGVWNWNDQTYVEVQRAYGGGRIEAVKLGNLEAGRVYGYDIVSAYPAQAVNLPSLKDATWQEIYGFVNPVVIPHPYQLRGLKESDISDTALYDIAWTWEADKADNKIGKKHRPWDQQTQPFYPLWYRDSDGTIYYPRSGRGTYWGSEVRNVVKYYEEGIHYVLVQAWELSLPHGDERPFAFVGDAFRHRKIFKRQGNMAHEALKLGLNSIYGKLAQQVGYNEKQDRLPTYHELIWAGMITAGCRAKMFDAAMQDPEAVIFFATDGIYTTRPLTLKIGKDLGDWEEETYDGITVAQAGVYWLKQTPEMERMFKGAGYGDKLEEGWEDIGQWSAKYRGFDQGSLSRDRVIEAWRKNEHYLTAYTTRFVGMGGALMLGDDFAKYWRRWITSERQLALFPDTKRKLPSVGWDKELGGPTYDLTCFPDGLCATLSNDPVWSAGYEHSEPYPLLWMNKDTHYKQVESMRTILDEEADSYE